MCAAFLAVITVLSYLVRTLIMSITIITVVDVRIDKEIYRFHRAVLVSEDFFVEDVTSCSEATLKH